MTLNKPISDRTVRYAEWTLILVTACLPLLFKHPYRINLFLAWEGAYRMSIGEIPYRDFGSPVGYGFWILPALFFKLFGPRVFVLLITQAFINVISNFTFRGLLNVFGLAGPKRMLALLVYCLSFSLFNFWPWYNHLVFVLELVGVYVLCKQLIKEQGSRRTYAIAASAFLVAFAFMTKQDTGGLALGMCLVLLAYDFWTERKLKSAIIFVLAWVASMTLLIAPFLQYDFSYWFNVGQFPHNSRVNSFDLINEFLGASSWIKFYLIVIIVLIMTNNNFWPSFLMDKKKGLFTLVVALILGQAAIIQVTSYTPVDGNIYFHSFAFAFILFLLPVQEKTFSILNVAILALVITLWWSGFFWTRFLREKVEHLVAKPGNGEVVSKKNYIVSTDTITMERSNWIPSSLPTLKRIKIPDKTEKGIKDLLAFTKGKNFKILNLSELTFLAKEIPYELEHGEDYPLWYHKGVAFFDREVERFCHAIENKEYDIILFENIPDLNNFYPFEVQDCIKANYSFRNKFLAPRIPEFSYVEVYVREDIK